MKTQKNDIEKPPVFIDPMTDFGFKRLFGTDPNKDLLIAFLNEVFRGRREIVDLVYNKQEYTGDTRFEGGVIFDLLCTGQDGERFLIEVQRGQPKNFKHRTIFYTSRLFSQQAPHGKRRDWNYLLTPVYLIALLEDFIFDGEDQDTFIRHFSIRDDQTCEKFYEGLSYTFIELRKFVKTDVELENDLDRWLYVLKNMNKLDKIPTFLRKPVFEKLFNIATYSNLSKEEKTMYDSAQKKRWDDYAVKEHAVEEGIKKNSADIAVKLRNQGLSIEQIADATGLTPEEIEKLPTGSLQQFDKGGKNNVR